MIRTSLFPLLAALLLIPSLASAQDAAPTPGAIVVRYWQCDSDVVSELSEWVREDGVDRMQSVVDEGHIISWGQLQHAWSDEWNWVDYFVVESVSAFFDAWPTILAAYEGADEGMMDRFQSGCRAHKDNIYGVVTQTAPAGG